jgi:hypothetical protein
VFFLNNHVVTTHQRNLFGGVAVSLSRSREARVSRTRNPGFPHAHRTAPTGPRVDRRQAGSHFVVAIPRGPRATVLLAMSYPDPALALVADEPAIRVD